MPEMTGWSDEQLVKACLEGSDQAWSALIDKYKNLIFAIPVKYGISRNDANEIFQQVCLKLLSELPRIRDPRCVGAWLIRVTSHNCFHWGRRERLYEQMSDEIGDAGQGVSGEQADERLWQIQREQALRAALLEISPRCRQLIHMLFYEDPALPYEEVARKLTLARGSIGFIRMRCLRQLRLRLKEKHFDER